MARKISKILITKQQNTINNTRLANKMESISKKLNVLSTIQANKSENNKNSYSKNIPLEIEKISNKLLHLNDIVVSKFIQNIVLKNIRKIGLKELFEMKKFVDREIAFKCNNKENDGEEEDSSLGF